MKGYRYLAPAGFEWTSGRARLAAGLRSGVWGLFPYPSKDEETEACRKAASDQFDRWFLVTEPKEKTA